MANLSGPQRIVCLTEETTETLYLLGEESRIVGVSGFTCRPKEARSKPRVSAFTSAKIDKILVLHPDLVIGFSNLQADVARDLIRAGLNVMVVNQRSVTEIRQMIVTLARVVGAESKGTELVDRLHTPTRVLRRMDGPLLAEFVGSKNSSRSQAECPSFQNCERNTTHENESLMRHQWSIEIRK